MSVYIPNLLFPTGFQTITYEHNSWLPSKKITLKYIYYTGYFYKLSDLVLCVIGIHLMLLCTFNDSKYDR